jgi:septum formation protein
MEQIILASASPRRKELLEFAGVPYISIVSQADETIEAGFSPRDAVLCIAQKKAQAVADHHLDRLCLAADTIVVLDGCILGKPADAEDAVRMLRLLAGRTHSVLTGVCLRKAGRERVFASETQVKFYPLTNEEIEAYVATGEPSDKAGAYGIQGMGALFVEAIHGDYYAVVGLPIARVVREIAAFLGEE